MDINKVYEAMQSGNYNVYGEQQMPQNVAIVDNALNGNMVNNQNTNMSTNSNVNNANPNNVPSDNTNKQVIIPNTSDSSANIKLDFLKTYLDDYNIRNIKFINNKVYVTDSKEHSKMVDDISASSFISLANSILRDVTKKQVFYENMVITSILTDNHYVDITKLELIDDETIKNYSVSKKYLEDLIHDKKKVIILGNLNSRKRSFINYYLKLIDDSKSVVNASSLDFSHLNKAFYNYNNSLDTLIELNTDYIILDSFNYKASDILELITSDRGVLVIINNNYLLNYLKEYFNPEIIDLISDNFIKINIDIISTNKEDEDDTDTEEDAETEDEIETLEV